VKYKILEAHEGYGRTEKTRTKKMVFVRWSLDEIYEGSFEIDPKDFTKDKIDELMTAKAREIGAILKGGTVK